MILKGFGLAAATATQGCATHVPKVICPAAARQRRWKFVSAEKQVDQEAREALGKGLWAEDLLPSGLPKTAFWGKLRIPEFDYTRRRRGKSIHVGIDLGTTNSCVTYMDPDSKVPVVVPIAGKQTTPTVVGLTGDKERYFGHKAFELARSAAGVSVCSGKRLLGKSLIDPRLPKEVYADVVELTQSEFGLAVSITQYSEKKQTPQERAEVTARDPHDTVSFEYPVVYVIALFLRYLKTEAEDELGMNVDSACITVPAHFSPSQRKATEDAAIIAGLDVMEIMDEPSAAALAYRELVAGTTFHKQSSGKVLVFDLGGGTFDLAILAMDFVKGGSKIIGSGGDDLLGGDDFDQYIVDYWKKELTDHVEFNLEMTMSFDLELRREAANAKIALDHAEEYSGNVMLFYDALRVRQYSLRITRFEYEELIKPLLLRMDKCVEAVFKEAGVSLSEVDDVLLVGEMTRTPLILKYVERSFGKKPVFSTVASPGTVVASGAVLRANQLLDYQNGVPVENFVFDEHSVQYRKQLGSVQGFVFDAKEAWRKWQARRKMSVSAMKEQALKENGLTEDQIEALSRKLIETELSMSKSEMLKQVQDECAALLAQIGQWKDPRLGFEDSVLEELLEVCKFWNRACGLSQTNEEQLAQAVWELRFYFEELAGSSVETALEKMAHDPETQAVIKATNPVTAKPSRTFKKPKKVVQDPPADS